MHKFVALLLPLVALIALSLLFLFRSHWATHSFNVHSIDFYPGKYGRVVTTSGAEVAASLIAVYAAANPSAFTIAVAAVQKLVDAGDAEAAFRLGRFYHLE